MQPLTILLTLAILPGLVACTSSLINTTCSAIPEMSYDYCVAVLSADPAGASAKDKRGLAVVAANQSVHNVTSTLHMLSDLVQQLNTCIEYYKYMGDLTTSAIDDFHAGRDAEVIYEKLRRASDEPLSCDMALYEGATKNPVEKENSENKYLAHLASGITFLMVNGAS
jgi:pectinesterase inhibitor-like protein